jgi:hypothetical protein
MEYENIYVLLSYLESVEEKIRSAKYYLKAYKEKLESDGVYYSRDLDLVDDALSEVIQMISWAKKEILEHK